MSIEVYNPPGLPIPGGTLLGPLVVEQATDLVAFSTRLTADAAATSRYSVTQSGITSWGLGGVATDTTLDHPQASQMRLKTSVADAEIDLMLETHTVSTGNAPVLRFRRYGGTDAAPAVIPLGGRMARLNFSAYDGTAAGTGAEIRVNTDAAEAWDTTHHAAVMSFLTVATGGSTSLTERARISPNGTFQVASTTAQASIGAQEKFRVNTPTTTDALANSILSSNNLANHILVLEGAASQSGSPFGYSTSAGSFTWYSTTTGTWAMGSGSSAGPAYSYQAETTLGWYRQAAGKMRASVNADVVEINSSGLKVYSFTAFGSVESFRNQSPTTVDNTVNAMLSASATTAVPLVAQGAPSHAANFFGVQTSAGTNMFSVNSGGNVVMTGALAVGANVAATGQIRLPNNVTVRTRNAANSGDVDLIQVNGSNQAQIGGTAAVGILFSVSASEVARMAGAGLLVNSTSALGTVEKFRVNTPTTVRNDTNTMFAANAAADRCMVLQGAPSQSVNVFQIQNSAATVGLSIADTGSMTFTDAANIVFGTTTGTKFGTATSQKLALWNKTPIVQPTNAIAAATFVTNTSLIANDSATYGGYTCGQIAAALIATGILA